MFNECWSARTFAVRFLKNGSRLTKWDPYTGKRTLLEERIKKGKVVTLKLDPVQTVILTLEVAGAGSERSIAPELAPELAPTSSPPEDAVTLFQGEPIAQPEAAAPEPTVPEPTVPEPAPEPAPEPTVSEQVPE